MNTLKRLLAKLHILFPEPCRHLHYIERRWLDATGCPWVHFHCKDCGYDDRGHVHGDSEGWEGTTET